MKRFLLSILILIAKSGILAILSFALHSLTTLPFLEAVGLCYSIHIIAMLLFENYYTLIKTLSCYTAWRLF